MVPSIIGTDLSITGNVVSKGEIQVDGEIQGDIHCTSLIVGEQAIISGGIVSEDVVIRGKVQGSVRGMRVTLQSTAQVEGDIFHQSLAVEQGAFFEGKSRRSEDPISSIQTADLKAKPASTSSGSSAPANPVKNGSIKSPISVAN